MRRALAILIAAATLFAPTAALADDSYDITEDRGADYAVSFFDDVLDGSAYGANGGIIKVRPQTARRTLLRPRTSFVRQLINSVEQL